MVSGVIQWNLKRLQKQNRILEQKVAERTAEVVQKNEELGKAFEEIRTQNDILAHQKEEIESQKEHIEDSIRYALQIQTAILPQVTELTAHIPNSFILWRPAHTVSGDFYWCAGIDDIVYAAAVDCTGHGVPGAFMTMIGNTLLNQIVRADKVIYPDQILNRLHVGVRRALKQDIEGEIKSRDGMDISFIVVNKKEQKLYWAGANNPLVYVREGVLTEIKADKYPIGGIQTEAERKFTLHTIEYQPGDTFFVYSDGFQDQFGGEKGRKYMVKPFQELLRRLSISDIPITDFGQYLDAEIVRWMAFGKGYPQRDDICIIGMRL
jgi:serine phosphatase RsbU (regulator of sigma subunit)